jgi:hypothetical protein
MVFATPLATLITISTLITFASAVTVQKPLLQLPADAAQNRQTVKEMFLYSYNAYKSVFPHGAAVAHPLTVIAGTTRGVMMTLLQSVKGSLTTATDGVRQSLTPCPLW